jgi:hypothetical protein
MAAVQNGVLLQEGLAVSDHFSGPRALAGPHGDIADLYAFPSPERPGSLVMVMNVLPNAGPDASFSEAIACRFRLRPVTIAATGPAAALPFGPEEVAFTCTFMAACQPDLREPPIQVGVCTVSDGQTLPFQVHDSRGNSADGLRVFAGLRADPFFLDFAAISEVLRTGRLTFPEVGTNAAVGANVLSIVIEVASERLRSLGSSLVAVAAETVAAGPLPIRLERVGRPEIKNILLAPQAHDTLNRAIELRDLYNLEDPYHQSKEYRGAYRARLSANLAFLDGLDGRTDWPLEADGTHPLAGLLLADHLVLDLSRPYAEDSFFEIERAALQGRPHQTCGGRSLNDDVMDTLYTLWVNAGTGPRISDHVDGPAVPTSRSFPYLAPPHAAPAALATARVPAATAGKGQQP